MRERNNDLPRRLYHASPAGTRARRGEWVRAASQGRDPHAAEHRATRRRGHARRRRAELGPTERWSARAARRAATSIRRRAGPSACARQAPPRLATASGLRAFAGTSNPARRTRTSARSLGPDARDAAPRSSTHDRRPAREKPNPPRSLGAGRPRPLLAGASWARVRMGRSVAERTVRGRPSCTASTGAPPLCSPRRVERRASLAL